MRPEPAPDAAPPVTSGTLLEKIFPADFRWIRRVIHEVEDLLQADGYATDDISSVSIILAEALNNCVEHAYGETEGGEITLVIRRRSVSLLFEIRDKGRPMPKGRAPLGNHPMSEFDPNDAMPEGGYGWFLIRELVRDLVYDRQNDENILFFRYRLSA